MLTHETMDEESYLWISTGGCEKCDAMEVIHVGEPERPHPNCECTIIAADDLCEDDYVAILEDFDFDVDDSQHPPKLVNFRLTIHLTVFCPVWEREVDETEEIEIDGLEIEFIEFETVIDPMDIMGAAIDEIEEWADRLCLACGWG